ncbi:MAG: PPOX class F420-dependent oxidoreductase [Anaerolineae bacterium]|nr:PPOX class F420-dependent oxidoreductase [Anaerolineae bacterium]
MKVSFRRKVLIGRHEMVSIPDTHKDLIERPIVAALATLMPDNQPQVTPVWFGYEDGFILVNTARGRQKDRNMSERPKVTLLVIDPDNPYRYLEIRGTVIEINEEEGLEHINTLTRRYTSRDQYFTNEEDKAKQQRAVFKIKPDSINAG